jgi:hypothetical protein
MKTNFMNKAFALLTSVLTASAMTASVSVFAVDSPTIDSLPAHKLETSRTVADIPIKKDILLFNSEKKRIPEPNIVYEYQISSANVTDASISTKDSDDATVILAVRPGVLEAVTSITDSGTNSEDVEAPTEGNQEEEDFRTGTITFGNDITLKMTNRANDVPYNSSSDCKATKQMDIKIDASKIYDTDSDGEADNEPGVYRYKITEVTADAVYAASGVTEGTAGDTIFLDVYTKYNEAKDNLVIYGYVLLKSTESGADTSITYNEEAKEGVKIDGFVTTAEGDDDGSNTIVPADFKGDYYNTYNVDVKELVAGDLADRLHEFPFRIQLSNDIVTSGSNFSVNDGAIHSLTSLTTTGKWDSNAVNIDGIDFKLKYGDVISLIGLPAGTKIMVTETNDTEDVYSVSAVFNDTAKPLVNSDATKVGPSISIPKNDTASLDTSNNTSYPISMETSSDKVIITNTLRDVSVTGLLFDIAPFLFITSAGIFLFTLYLRNKKETDADNMI